MILIYGLPTDINLSVGLRKRAKPRIFRHTALTKSPILLIAIVVLVLFGRGKISSLMGEVGKGITSFKKGINEGKEELEAEDAAEAAKDVTPADADKDKA